MNTANIPTDILLRMKEYGEQFIQKSLNPIQKHLTAINQEIESRLNIPTATPYPALGSIANDVGIVTGKQFQQELVEFRKLWESCTVADIDTAWDFIVLIAKSVAFTTDEEKTFVQDYYQYTYTEWMIRRKLMRGEPLPWPTF